jgi:hypothetical protein
MRQERKKGVLLCGKPYWVNRVQKKVALSLSSVSAMMEAFCFIYRSLQ